VAHHHRWICAIGSGSNHPIHRRCSARPCPTLPWGHPQRLGWRQRLPRSKTRGHLLVTVNMNSRGLLHRDQIHTPRHARAASSPGPSCPMVARSRRCSFVSGHEPSFLEEHVAEFYARSFMCIIFSPLCYLVTCSRRSFLFPLSPHSMAHLTPYHICISSCRPASFPGQFNIIRTTFSTYTFFCPHEYSPPKYS
jgi:hypothetical protein